MKRIKYIDWAIIAACVAGYAAEFLNLKWADIAEWFLGGIAIVYCLYYLAISFFSPIKRDWILAKGRFLVKVVNFVLLVPFLFILAFNTADSLNGKEEKITPSAIFSEDEKSDDQRQEVQPTLFWSVYYHFIDPGNQHMATSKGGQQRAAVVAILGFLLLNGLLISTLINWFDRRREQWITGGIRYNSLALRCKKIAVVIGANESTPTIIKRLIEGYGESPIDYVILLTNEDVVSVREQILSYLTYNEEQHVIIYNGQLDSPEEINRLHLKRATEIYVLGESSNDDRSQSYHDTQNMRCVHNIASYLSHRHIERKIICRVSFEYQTTYSVFQFSDLPANIREHLIFIPFNPYENWAQRVFVVGNYDETITEPRTIKYIPLDGAGITPTSREYVHLVVVGMSKMGVAMAIQAAQVAHYPNFSTGRYDDKGNTTREPSPIRTRITFIDEKADNEMHFFKGRYQNMFELARHRYVDASGESYNANTAWTDPVTLESSRHRAEGGNFIDIEWEFVKGSVQSPGVMSYLRDAAALANSSLDTHSLLTIAICRPLAHEAIASALYMPGEVYDTAQQILVYQREASDIVYNLCKEGVYTNKRYAKLRPFGMHYADFTMDKDNYYRAQLCNYVYKLLFDDDVKNDDIIDILGSMNLANRDEAHMQAARAKWNKLSVCNKWSNRYLANSFEAKLRSVGAKVDVDNIAQHYAEVSALLAQHKEDMAECEHNRWNVQQLLIGFRAYRDDDFALFRALRAKASSSAEAKAKFESFKSNMKTGPERAHLNICSMALLNDLDKGTVVYDEILNSSIPTILQLIEQYNRTSQRGEKHT